jgi:hypothetical protein
MMTPPPLGLPRICTGPESSIHGVMVQQGSILPVNNCLGNALGLDGRPLARLMMMEGDIFENQAFVSQPFVLHHDAYTGAFGYEAQYGVCNNLNMYNNAVPHPASLCGIENIPIYNDEHLIHVNKRSKVKAFFEAQLLPQLFKWLLSTLLILLLYLCYSHLKREEIREDKEMGAQRKRIHKEIEREELARRKVSVIKHRYGSA